MRIVNISRNLVVTLSVLTGATLAAADTPPPESSESVVSPAESTRVSRQDAIDSMELVEQAIQDANRYLAEGNVKQFAVSYTAAIDAIARAVQTIRTHVRGCGKAQSELGFALAELQKLQKQLGQDVQPSAWQPKLTEVRTSLLAELKTLHGRHESIGDGEERQLLRQRMNVLLERLNMLDQWLPSAQEHVESPPRLNLKQAVAQVTILRDQLRQEDQLIELAAVMLSDAIQAARADVQRTLQLLAVQAEIPTDLRERLKAFSHTVTTSLYVIQQSRKVNAQTAQQIADQIGQAQLPDCPAVIGEAANRLGIRLPAPLPKVVQLPVRTIRCPDGSYIRIR